MNVWPYMSSLTSKVTVIVLIWNGVRCYVVAACKHLLPLAASIILFTIFSIDI